MAEKPSPTDARTYYHRGNTLYEKGDYAPALDRLNRAYQVVRAPTLCLWLARALAKNGKLVEILREEDKEITHEKF